MEKKNSPLKYVSVFANDFAKVFRFRDTSISSLKSLHLVILNMDKLVLPSGKAMAN